MILRDRKGVLILCLTISWLPCRDADLRKPETRAQMKRLFSQCYDSTVYVLSMIADNLIQVHEEKKKPIIQKLFLSSYLFYYLEWLDKAISICGPRRIP